MRLSTIVRAYAFLSVCAFAQVPTTPAVIPHLSFVNQSGLPCATCKLYTYAAGTTTPLATYTSASGTSMNTNPITLDASGSAYIWVGTNSYKFVLKDALGSTLWTVDQVNAGSSLFSCASANAILAANSTATGATCDPIITINTTAHTINVGTLPANYVTIGALGTPTTWTFDTTSPATARASIGAGSVTSVDMTVPLWLAVSGNPITSSGTLAVTAAAGQTANQFLATPNGATGAVGLRAIAPADLPLGTNAAFGAVRCDSTTITCASGIISATGTAATCNTNGCYITMPGGTIIQWGTANGCGSGGSCTTAVSFPTSFTTTTNLALTISLSVGSTNWVAGTNGKTTSGFTATYAPLVYVGGTGNNLDGSERADWIAIGK